MSAAHHDRVLRHQLALDATAQVAALTAQYGESLPTTRRTPPPRETSAADFTPLAGTLTTRPTGGLSWKPTPWPSSAMNHAQDDVIRVCIDHSHLEPRCRRAPREIARLTAEIGRWQHVRGIHAFRSHYGTPDGWTMPTLALVLHDALRAIPTIHTGLTLNVDDAIVRASTFDRRRTPSRFRVEAQASTGEDGNGLVSCCLYFAPDAAHGVRDWMAHFPSLITEQTSDECTLARVIRLKLATNSPPSLADADAECADDPDDDDSEDLISRALLRTIRTYLAPAASWDDIKAYVRGMTCALSDKYGERP